MLEVLDEIECGVRALRRTHTVSAIEGRRAAAELSHMSSEIHEIVKVKDYDTMRAMRGMADLAEGCKFASIAADAVCPVRLIQSWTNEAGDAMDEGDMFEAAQSVAAQLIADGKAVPASIEEVAEWLGVPGTVPEVGATFVFDDPCEVCEVGDGLRIAAMLHGTE